MTNLTIKQMPAFKRTYKKLRDSEKEKVNQVIRAIVEKPTIGQEKKGDLAGVWVYKFKLHHQELLLAYEWSLHERLLLALSVHENFYRDLKKRKT